MFEIFQELLGLQILNLIFVKHLVDEIIILLIAAHHVNAFFILTFLQLSVLTCSELMIEVVIYLLISEICVNLNADRRLQLLLLCSLLLIASFLV